MSYEACFVKMMPLPAKDVVRVWFDIKTKNEADKAYIMTGLAAAPGEDMWCVIELREKHHESIQNQRMRVDTLQAETLQKPLGYPLYAEESEDSEDKKPDNPEVPW